MFYSKAVIQYDGSNYAGFQWQKNAHTIQAEINHALKRVQPGVCTTMSASRTDSGVHALDQVIRITSSLPLEHPSMLQKLHETLPSQIRVLSLEACERSFNPALDSTSKQYSYLFTNRQRASQFDRKYIANISNPLNLERLHACANMIQGSHDFCNFVSTGSSVKSTQRHVLKCELNAINPHEFFANTPLFHIDQELQSCFEFKIEANGFLKQMIRHLVAALWRVGSGKMELAQFESLLSSSKHPQQLWRVATPSGLYLTKINYNT